jgi:hypothetical protein
MITFPKSISIEACEKLLKDINQANSESDLLLPVDTAKYAFGGLALAIQVSIAWGRKSEGRKLLLRESNKPVEDQIDEVIKRPHKFAAAMFAKSILLNEVGNSELRNKVNLVGKNAIERQSVSRYGQQHGGLCWFAFVDHSTKGFDRNFYIDSLEKKPEPRDPAQIQSIIHAMIEKSLTVAGGGKPPEGDDMDHLGRVFFELFLNTHEHGTRGYSRSEWLKPGIRVIYTNGINLSADGVDGTLQGEPVLSNYLAALNSSRNRFVEISIVDSGLGFWKRWLADSGEINIADTAPIEDEYEIFKKCFQFRQTSTSKNNKGHGLPVVMDRLTKLKGFIRIRSGRLALYRNFIATPYRDGDKCEFSDWASRGMAIESLTAMSPVEGVAITMLIPLEAKQ